MGSFGASQVALVVKSLPANTEDVRDPWIRKIPWRRALQPPPVFLPGESHGQRSLAGYSPWRRQEWDTTEHIIHTHTSFWLLPQQVTRKVAAYNTKLLLHVTNLKSRYCQGWIPSEFFKREILSLPFPTSRDWLHFLAPTLRPASISTSPTF